MVHQIDLAALGIALENLIKDASLPEKCVAAAAQWCYDAGCTKLQGIADHIEQFSAALGLKLLEQRRLKKVLASTLQGCGERSDHSATVSAAQTKRVGCSSSLPQARRPLTLGRVRIWRSKFVPTLETVPEGLDETLFEPIHTDAEQGNRVVMDIRRDICFKKRRVRILSGRRSVQAWSSLDATSKPPGSIAQRVSRWPAEEPAQRMYHGMLLVIRSKRH